MERKRKMEGTWMSSKSSREENMREITHTVGLASTLTALQSTPDGVTGDESNVRHAGTSLQLLFYDEKSVRER